MQLALIRTEHQLYRANKLYVYLSERFVEFFTWQMFSSKTSSSLLWQGNMSEARLGLEWMLGPARKLLWVIVVAINSGWSGDWVMPAVRAATLMTACAGISRQPSHLNQGPSQRSCINAFEADLAPGHAMPATCCWARLVINRHIKHTFFPGSKVPVEVRFTLGIVHWMNLGTMPKVQALC